MAITGSRPAARVSTARWVRRELFRYRMAYLFLLPAFALLLFVDFVPMVQGVWTSLYSYNMFRPGVNPFVGFDQYRLLFQDDTFRRAFWQSWYFTAGSVAGQFVLGLMAALLLNQTARMRGFFRGLVLIPWVVPGSLTAMMFALMFTSNGLVNTTLSGLGLMRPGLIPPDFPWLSNTSTAMPVLVLTSAWKGFPFFTVMLLAAMQTVPRDLYEAARVDGASAYRSFRHVTLPGIRTTMIVATLFGGIWTFNSIDLIYIMTYGGPYYSTMTLVMLSYQQAFGRGLVSYASAISVVILVLMSVLSVFYLSLYRRIAAAQE